MAELKKDVVSGANTLKKVKSDEVGQHKDESAEALTPKAPPPTHDEGNGMGPEQEAQPTEPTSQAETAAGDPKHAKVKPQEPAGLDKSLEASVATDRCDDHLDRHAAARLHCGNGKTRDGRWGILKPTGGQATSRKRACDTCQRQIKEAPRCRGLVDVTV